MLPFEALFQFSLLLMKEGLAVFSHLLCFLLFQPANRFVHKRYWEGTELQSMNVHLVGRSGSPSVCNSTILGTSLDHSVG